MGINIPIPKRNREEQEMILQHHAWQSGLFLVFPGLLQLPKCLACLFLQFDHLQGTQTLMGWQHSMSAAFLIGHSLILTSAISQGLHCSLSFTFTSLWNGILGPLFSNLLTATHCSTMLVFQSPGITSMTLQLHFTCLHHVGDNKFCLLAWDVVWPTSVSM